MRVHVISDIEGVAGIVKWAQTGGENSTLYHEGRKLYTEEINAAVRGALAAGATEIVAVECHGAGGDWNFDSYIPELLHPDCEWVAHHKWARYTELLEKGCDAALMVGMTAEKVTVAAEATLLETESGAIARFDAPAPPAAPRQPWWR